LQQLPGGNQFRIDPGRGVVHGISPLTVRGI
jgi:hypothetical protein